MHPNTIKEQMSIAHLIYVAAVCEATVEHIRVDIGSVDATIRHFKRLDPADVLLRKSIDVQIKATSDYEWKKGKCAFDVPIKNYNDFREPGSDPGILLVYQMPKDLRQWLEHSKDCLVTRHAMYWHNMNGMPGTDNAESRRIHLLEANLFSPATLLEMMRRIGRGEELGNVL